MKRLLAVILVMTWATIAQGAGPILVDTTITGNAVVWPGGQVTYHPETGSGTDGMLGVLTNSEALGLVRDLFDAWASITLNSGAALVSTVALSVTEGAGLGNVSASNIDDHFTYCPPNTACASSDPPFVLGSARSGESPIIFDENGALTDAILGSGASADVLGFAGPRVVDRSGSELFIGESQSVINGRFIDCAAGALLSDPCQSPEVSLTAFKAAIFHELGHFLGLDHTQVNFDSIVDAINGSASAEEDITTMLPIFVGPAQLSPHYDDKVSISSLYPTSAFLNDFCTISGTVFSEDGTTPLQGINVIARRLTNPTKDATSFVSGALYTGDSDCTEAVGDFLIHGIRPGELYSLEIEPIAFAFQGGSSIEPCDRPQTGFNAVKAGGSFSCSAGGNMITGGTDFVTSKQQTTGDSGDSGDTTSSSSSSCSLRPLASHFFPEQGLHLRFIMISLVLLTFTIVRCRVVHKITRLHS